ncbi:MAG: hypothetical protein L6R36_001973 [Xanthoria steineri]|nr:MAG: hypothetical protein L6R36_001973 [Xanthoria steineri]
MYHSLLAHLPLLLLFSNLAIQTNIEYWDSDTVDPSEAHIVQQFRFLSGGECCVPVDLAIPQTGRIERFLPYKIVFEYFSTDVLFVFANANNEPACRGPPVGFYQQDDRPRRPVEYVKDFVRTPTQRWTGATFLPVRGADDGHDNNVNGTASSVATTVANGNETEPRDILAARDPPPLNVVYPWSISYRGLIHYQTPRGSLNYIDINGRSRLRALPQFGTILFSFLEFSRL